MVNQMLIPRYLGGKTGSKYPVWDGQSYDLLLSPFFGSGRQEVEGLQKGYAKAARIADCDPAVRAVINEWLNWETSEVSQWVDSFVDPIIHNQLIDGHSDVFQDLKTIIDNKGQGTTNPQYAAAKILLHQFVRGGNVRCNNEGLLNVSPRTDKPDWAEWLKGYSYELPWRPPNRDIRLFDDWSKVFESFDINRLKTIAFIDPPYSAPGPGQRSGGIGMSKAYAYHGSPNDPALLRMHKDAVIAAFNCECDRIVATNYHGHWLQQIEYDNEGVEQVLSQEWVQYEQITKFMQELGFHFHDLGPLSGCTPHKVKPEKAGQRRNRAVRNEGWWELGGVRQHGRVVQPELNLWEAVA